MPVWSITQGSNLVTLTNNSNGSVTLTSSQYSGTIKLSATFGNINCGFRTLEKTITIGNNSTNFRLTVIDRYCANNFHYIVLRPFNSPTNFDGFSNFTPNAGIFTTPFNGTNDVVFRVPGNYVGNASFSVLGSNSSCGKFKYTFTIGSIYDCQFIQLPRMSEADDEKRFYVYPNPSKNVVYVSLNDDFKNTSTKTTIKAELFDLFAVRKGSIRILDNSAMIDVSGLTEGIYILKIYLDDTIESHQIIVQ
ncbi:T9SS type A sorting domain-containing protein [Microcoleus sp. herbarium8]